MFLYGNLSKNEYCANESFLFEKNKNYSIRKKTILHDKQSFFVCTFIDMLYTTFILFIRKI